MQNRLNFQTHKVHQNDPVGDNGQWTRNKEKQTKKRRKSETEWAVDTINYRVAGPRPQQGGRRYNRRTTPSQIQTDEVRLLREGVNSLLENQGVRSGQVTRLEDLPPRGESNFSNIQARMDRFERTLSHPEAENSPRDVPVSGAVKSKARTSKKNKSRKSKKKSAKVQDEPSSLNPSSTSLSDDSKGTQVRTQARPDLNMGNALNSVRTAPQDPDPVA